jgi:ribosomal-protein-alanine N-acetyltransferase
VVVLKSDRFLLRPFREGDEASLQKNINNEKIYKNTLRIPYPYTMDDAIECVKKNIELEMMEKKTSIHFVIDISGDVIGAVSLTNIENHEAEMGYWLAEKYWGQEIMPEAIRLVEEYAFGKIGLSRIYAKIFNTNERSAAVVKKCGYRLEKELNKSVIKDGKYCDELLYSKVK